jgi:hypothetical protein
VFTQWAKHSLQGYLGQGPAAAVVQPTVAVQPPATDHALLAHMTSVLSKLAENQGELQAQKSSRRQKT